LAKEMKAYKEELSECKTKADRYIFERFSELYDEELADKVLMMYMTRTKNRHALAFLQFRATLPKAKIGDIKEMF
jgi:hypothetical protein